MTISVVNTKAAKFIKHKQRNAVGITINSIMPNIISENHH